MGKTYREDRNSYDATGMYEYNGEPKWGVPKNKDSKFQLTTFLAKETHKGLGTGVNEWIEEVKMDVLEGHLEGKALDYWQVKRDSWTGSTLEHTMEALKKNYRCTWWGWCRWSCGGDSGTGRHCLGS